MEAETDIASFWGGGRRRQSRGLRREGGREEASVFDGRRTNDSKKGRGEKRGAPKPSTFN